MIESVKIRNDVTGNIIKLDMSEANYLIYEGSIDWGTVDVSHNTFQYPTQIGSYISSTTVGSRDVSISGWIIGNTLAEIEKKKDILSKHINPLQDLTIIAGDYCISGRPDTNVKYGNSYAENNEAMCKFLIQIFCSQPMFLLTNAIDVNVADTQGMFGFPLILKPQGIILGLRKKSLFTDITNDGAVEVGMTVTIETFGTVKNPRIINVNTNEYMRINKTLQSGEKIVIDTNKGKRSIYSYINGVKTNYFDYFDFDNTWLQVPNGISTFTYKTYEDDYTTENDTYKNMNVTISYRSALYNIGGE